MIEEIVRKSKEYREVVRNKKSGRLPHAMLLVSADDDYIDIMVESLQKLILCESSGAEDYCGECPLCQKVSSKVAVDVETIFNEKGIKVDDVEASLEKLYVRPYEALYKIITIRGIDQANEMAQNKLLKSLEEPPAHVIFILTARSTNSVLQTILSRVQKFDIEPLSTEVIEKYLTACGVSSPAVISMESNGSLKEANRLKEGDTAKIVYNLVFDTMKNLRSTTELVTYVSKFEAHKDSLLEILDFWEIFTLDVLRCRTGGKTVVSSEMNLPDFMATAREFSVTGLLVFHEAILEAKRMESFHVSPLNIIDQLLLKLLEVKFKCR